MQNSLYFLLISMFTKTVLCSQINHPRTLLIYSLHYTVDVKLKSLPIQKKKYSRVRTMDDDGDDDDEKDQIADEIFTRDGDGDGDEVGDGGEPLHPGEDDEEEEGEESGRVSSNSVWHSRLNATMAFMLLTLFVVLLCTDIDDFIVDDDGQPITKKKGKKFTGYTDA